VTAETPIWTAHCIQSLSNGRRAVKVPRATGAADANLRAHPSRRSRSIGFAARHQGLVEERIAAIFASAPSCVAQSCSDGIVTVATQIASVAFPAAVAARALHVFERAASMAAAAGARLAREGERCRTDRAPAPTSRTEHAARARSNRRRSSASPASSRDARALAGNLSCSRMLRRARGLDCLVICSTTGRRGPPACRTEHDTIMTRSRPATRGAPRPRCASIRTRRGPVSISPAAQPRARISPGASPLNSCRASNPQGPSRRRWSPTSRAWARRYMSR